MAAIILKTDEDSDSCVGTMRPRLPPVLIEYALKYYKSDVRDGYHK